MSPELHNEELVAGLGPGFEARVLPANGIELHAVTGGSGPAVVLLHGFPQDWFEWRHVMPRLAESRSVIAVDLRGVGGSEAPEGGYDAPNLGLDIRSLLDGLGVDDAYIVGHDVGGWVAYAYARQFPETTHGVMLIESLVPGLDPPDAPKLTVSLWHADFQMIPGLPEALVADRQAVYFRYFFDVGLNDPTVISDDEVKHYAAAYGDKAHLRAAFEMYRALPATVAFNAEQRDPIDVPLTLLGGEHVFAPSQPALAALLRAAHGWTDVGFETIAGGRHYIVEEYPDRIVDLVLDRSASGN
ncbi:MAG: alpha/beta fold hydrolase [Acidimicrobiales bacterium]